MDRRLSAIMATDMVGYSRLMEVDDIGTIERQKAHRIAVIDPALAAYHGRVIKEMGDGLLIEFPSVVEAGQCAVRIQRGLSAYEARQPRDRRMFYRIGINLGDIVALGDDIQGDGVNVAARLEQIAEPGGICISGAAYEQMQNHLDAPVRDMGEQNLKNIDRPIHAYAIILDGSSAAPRQNPLWKSRRAVAVTLLALMLCIGVLAYFFQDGQRSHPFGPDLAEDLLDGGRAKLAVLPFRTLSEDESQNHFAFGMTEDLVTDLAKLSGLLIIGRNMFDPGPVDDAEVIKIAEELGVRYIVTGSLRQAGERLRINAQLLDIDTGGHLWAERYDRRIDDIFAVQDEVREQIVSALELHLTPDEARRIALHPTENREAYEAYLRAVQLESFFTDQHSAESIHLLEKALTLDPEFALAHARLAMAHIIRVEGGWAEDSAAATRLAQESIDRALEINPKLPQAHWAIARVFTQGLVFDSQRALEALNATVALDPGYSEAYALMGILLHYVGRAEEGLKSVETAMRLNPRYPFWYSYALGVNQFQLGETEAARSSLELAIERNAAWINTHLHIVPVYGFLGLIDDAEWEMEELRALGFTPTIQNWEQKIPIEDPDYRARFFEGLRRAGVPKS
ncbi:adenylate/guanylate cyclase domain-containing protein [Lutimaribacter marinistellae]|uniref:Adenylate/guanylate cyclase domain-containing protein n=1 Tax=Lutimaribacter marinistellae TaxID=1820329 RepID=A0ABV7TIU9_9RHOB